MKFAKRLLCTALVIIMASFASVTVFASNPFTDVTRYNEAIDTLYNAGVISGATSTTYNPNGNVTRWQMALLVSKMITGKETSYWENIPSKMGFDDVVTSTIYKHYPAAIAYANEQGIIKGIGGTKFDPDAGIKYQDGLIMALRALGYYKDGSATLAYPDDYISKAKTLELTEGLSDVGYTDTLTRGQTAQLLYNAYTATMSSGATIEDSIFGRSVRVVLVATENQRIYSMAPFAKNGMLVFAEISPYGVFTGETFEISASTVSRAVNYSNPNDVIGTSFNLKYTDRYSNVVSLEKNSSMSEISSGLSVSGVKNNTIKIGNETYTTRSNYSGKLTDGKTPTDKEIIVYALNDVFTSGTTILADSMRGTTAVYSLRTFDDNGDSYPDRAIYIPYSFGQYKTDTSNRIAIAGNRMKTEITYTGKTPAEGDYVLYSFDSQTKTLDIKSIYTTAKGYVGELTSSGTDYILKIKSNASSMTYSTYSLGYSSLPGVEDSAKLVSGLSGANIANREITYVADGTTILAYTLGTGSNQGTVGSYYASLYIVESITPGWGQSPMVTFKGVSGAFSIYSIDGSTNYVNGTVNVGDVVEATTVNNGPGIGGMPQSNYVAIVKRSNAPTYSTKSTSSYAQVTNNVFTILDGVVAGVSVQVDASTVIYVNDGITGIQMLRASDFMSAKMFGSYMSVFVVRSNGSLGSASMIYITKPDAGSIIGGTSMFTGLAYITVDPNLSNNYQTVNGAIKYYYTVFDMMSGTTKQAFMYTANTRLTSSGIYRLYQDASALYITDTVPVTTSIAGTTYGYYKGTITNASIIGTTLYMAIDGKVFTATGYTVYNKPSWFETAPINITSNIATNVAALNNMTVGIIYPISGAQPTYNTYTGNMILMLNP